MFPIYLKIGSIRKKLSFLLKEQLTGRINDQDLELLSNKLGDINRRTYRSNAEKLLFSLRLLHDRKKNI